VDSLGITEALEAKLLDKNNDLSGLEINKYVTVNVCEAGV
jgi:hypothetical protein